MKQKQWIWILALVLAAAVCSPAVAAEKPLVKWVPYEEGLEKGKKTDTTIFINFYADWCHYCDLMRDETLMDPEVAGYLNEHFVPIQVNADEKRKLAKKYSVQGLPMLWFLTPEGEGIAPLPGFLPANQFILVLKYIASGRWEELTFTEFMEEGLDKEAPPAQPAGQAPAEAAEESPEAASPEEEKETARPKEADQPEEKKAASEPEEAEKQEKADPPEQAEPVDAPEKAEEPPAPDGDD
jgi:thioredoxin-related protein